MEKGTLYCTSKSNTVLPYKDCYDITLTGESEVREGRCKRFSGLAPDWSTLRDFKKAPEAPERYVKYKNEYIHKLKTNSVSQRNLKQIQTFLEEGIDVNLTCVCPHYLKCHRFIIGSIFEKKGYKVIYG